jgi:hypothetical protein
MSNWGISPNASEKEKIKADYADILHGMNSTGAIPYDVYSDLFDAGMELFDRMYEHGLKDATDKNVGNKWISVEERLPDKDTLVLCIGAKGGMFLGFIRCYYEIQNGAYTYVPNSRGCRYATHWMPLPEPPEV